MKSLYAKVKYEPPMDVLPAIYRRVNPLSIHLVEDVVEDTVINSAELAAVLIENDLGLEDHP